MKNKINSKMFVASILAVLCFTAASAQTVSNKQSNDGSVQSREQISKQQYYQQQQVTAQKPHPVPLENRTWLTADKKPVEITKRSNANPVTATGKQTKPLSMEQLRLQKKQAADKGLPTSEYDNAMKELMKNQSK